ncbi:hypothetical protein NDU88_003636 [Pleurodeles waltl]|uniref:Uncharacterized protein n=1 Tax=Pleurodeles waltl TaxID=8319 RepID=A0AAV7LHL8_PLEWA|nr:hypothetical protein NDU88_003636 [Pleurodeles waltl]
MRAISGQSGTQVRVGDWGPALEAAGPPLWSRGAWTRLAAGGPSPCLEPGPRVSWWTDPVSGRAAKNYRETPRGSL